MVTLLDYFGVGVFAITGALAAGRKRMDLFGVLLLATVTAVGGGTTRDLLLGVRPVFWVSEPMYLLVIAVAALLTVITARRLSFFLERPLVYFDAFGLALFSVLGAAKAHDVGADWMASAVMGVLTGVFGGILRDVISDKFPLVLRSELYATCAVLGAGTYLALVHLEVAAPWPMVVGVTSALSLRLASLRWRLQLPVFSLDRSD